MNVTLYVPAATAGDSSAFRDVAGLVTFTPTGGCEQRDVTLRVPYYLVPQATSNISTTLGRQETGQDRYRDRHGDQQQRRHLRRGRLVRVGPVRRHGQGLGSNDVRNVGVQAFPGVPRVRDPTQNRWSNGGDGRVRRRSST